VHGGADPAGDELFSERSLGPSRHQRLEVLLSFPAAGTSRSRLLRERLLHRHPPCKYGERLILFGCIGARAIKTAAVNGLCGTDVNGITDGITDLSRARDFRGDRSRFCATRHLAFRR
jgi:hypothetical protein